MRGKHDYGLFTIYAIKCRATKRIYIGSTLNVQARIDTHFSELRRGKKLDPPNLPSEWQKDYDQYGEESFDVYLVDSRECSREAAVMLEQEYIRKYKATNPKYGYNKIKSKAVKDDMYRFRDGVPEVEYEYYRD